MNTELRVTVAIVGLIGGVAGGSGHPGGANFTLE